MAYISRKRDMSNHPRSDTALKLNIREEIAATLMDMTGLY